MDIKISQMSSKDYKQVYALWRSVEGMGLFNHSDSKQGISNYLRRNLGFSFVASDKKKIIGVVLCGHDGRRGYLYHLAVDQAYREKGIGKMLVNRAIKKLKIAGINRCHLFVFENNTVARKFWGKMGWVEMEEIKFMSRAIGKKDKMM